MVGEGDVWHGFYLEGLGALGGADVLDVLDASDALGAVGFAAGSLAAEGGTADFVADSAVVVL